MENPDTRTLNQDAQEEIRRQAIRQLKQGKTQTEVAQNLGVHQPTVNRWWKRYQEGGWAALKKKKRGRREGTDRFLTPEQEEEIQKVIVDKTPDQLKLSFALWSREAVRQLIEERFDVLYSLQAMSVILKRWGFTPQRPLKRAYEQRPAEVKKWMKESYPAVKQKAKEENAEIWWADETAVKPESHFRRGYSPKGQTPVVKQPAKRFHSSLISAISGTGKLQWMPLKEAMNAELFLKFLKQMIKGRKRKVILIVDNLKVHHSRIVRAWLEDKKDRIELVYLPAYSPEINPDEYLNNDLKQSLSINAVPREKNALDAAVSVAMFMLSIRPHRVRSFFQHPAVQYAQI